MKVLMCLNIDTHTFLYKVHLHFHSISDQLTLHKWRSARQSDINTMYYEMQLCPFAFQVLVSSPYISIYLSIIDM